MKEITLYSRIKYMKRPTVFQNEKLNIVKCRFLKSFIHKINAIPIKATVFFLRSRENLTT